MVQVTGEELTRLENRFQTILSRMDALGAEITWRSIEADLHAVYADLDGVGRRSSGRVKDWLVSAADSLLKAMRAYPDREETAQQAANVLCCLNRARHELERGET